MLSDIKSDWVRQMLHYVPFTWNWEKQHKTNENTDTEDRGMVLEGRGWELGEVIE